MAKDYWNHFQEKAVALLSQEAFYTQINLAGISLISAIAVSGLIRRWLNQRLSRKYHEENYLDQHYLSLAKLISPLLFILLLGLSSFFIGDLNAPTTIITAITKLAFVWLITELILLVVTNRIVAGFISGVAILLAALDATGLLNSTFAYLESISFELGTVKLSMLGISKGIVLFVLLFWLAGILSKSAERFIRKAPGLNYSSRELMVKFIKMFFYLVVFIITLSVVGVDLTALTVVGGALAVGIGFGLQKITSNFISGIILLFENSIKAGDLIEVGQDKGWVRNSGIRYTLIETFDGREMLIPNEELVTHRVTNWTYSNTRARIEFTIGVAYHTDLKSTIDLVLRVVKAQPCCISDPRPNVFIQQFGESAMVLQIVFWIADVNEGLLAPRSEVMLAVFEALKAQGVEVPYSRRDIHIKEMPNNFIKAGT